MSGSIKIGSEVRERFPDFAAFFAVTRSLAHTEDSRRAFEETVMTRLNATYDSVESIESHAFAVNYSEFYKKMGLKPKAVSTPAKQAARVFTNQQYRTILPVVDACMAVEYTSLVSFQAYDANNIVGDIEYIFASGDESIITFHGEEKKCKAGELILTDESGVLHSVYYGNHKPKMLSDLSSYALIRIMKVPGIPNEAFRVAIEEIGEMLNFSSSVFVSNSSPKGELLLTI